jgi:thiamine transport system permease protein
MAAGGTGMLKLSGSSGRPASVLANTVGFFAAAPVISSGIVLGLGWLMAYGRSYQAGPAALVILHAIIALPFSYNSISEGFRSLPGNTLNAAAALGAGPVRTLLTVAIPLSVRQMRSAWGFAAAISLGELNTVMMLGMESWETLPLYIYRAAAAYRYGTACAAGTLLMICFVLVFMLSEAKILTQKKRNKGLHYAHKGAQNPAEQTDPF